MEYALINGTSEEKNGTYHKVHKVLQGRLPYFFFFFKKEGSAGTTGPNITHEINTTKETNIERSRKQRQHKFSLER